MRFLKGQGTLKRRGVARKSRGRWSVLVLAVLCVVAPGSLVFFVGETSSAGEPAPGTWKYADGVVTDTETNVSGKEIKAFYLVLPAGVTVTGEGTLTGVTPSTCLPKQPGSQPNEVECFFPGGWANGTSLTYAFPVSDPGGKLTTAPLPSFTKYVSFDGATYAPAFELPPAQAANTPPAEAPCKCAELDGKLTKFHIFGAGTTRIEFDVAWELLCTPGAGNCEGKILVKAPPGARFLDQNGKKFPPKDKPTIVHVKCDGPCAKRTKGKTTLSYLALTTVKDKKGKTHTVPNPKFLPEGRAKKTFEVRVSIICANPPGVVKKLKLVFDKYGQVDKKKSKVTF
jgi:hypothetical protein